MTLRLGVLSSHPIQYQAPLFRELAKHVDLHVHYAHRQTPEGQAGAGFGIPFDWDIDLLSGYSHEFLPNVAQKPDVNRFFGCDTPAIATRISAGSFDAFFVTGWYLKTYWQAIHACRRCAVPIMVRGDSRLGTARSLIKAAIKAITYRHVLSVFDACLYVGQDSRDYFARYGVPPERLFFSPHCVDNRYFEARASGVTQADARKRLCLPTEGKVILFVGKLLARKRPLDLILAAASLERTGFPARVAIVGSGALDQELRSAANEHNVTVDLLGFKNQSEMPVVFKAADVLVLPSDDSETWGLVVNEAIASGLPVVVSNAVGCARDLVATNETGLVFPVGDVAALAQAIRSVLLNPPQHAAVLATARQFSVEAAALGVLEAAEYMCRHAQTHRT